MSRGGTAAPAASDGDPAMVLSDPARDGAGDCAQHAVEADGVDDPVRAAAGEVDHLRHLDPHQGLQVVDPRRQDRKVGDLHPLEELAMALAVLVEEAWNCGSEKEEDLVALVRRSGKVYEVAGEQTIGVALLPRRALLAQQPNRLRGQWQHAGCMACGPQRARIGVGMIREVRDDERLVRGVRLGRRCRIGFQPVSPGGRCRIGFQPVRDCPERAAVSGSRADMVTLTPCPSPILPTTTTGPRTSSQPSPVTPMRTCRIGFQPVSTSGWRRIGCDRT